MASKNLGKAEYLKLLQELEDNLRIEESREEVHENYELNNGENTDFELVTGYRSTSKLLWVSSDNCFYKQNAYSKKYDGTAYTCYDNECKARKVLTANNTKLITIAAEHIAHLSMESMYWELYYLNLMKRMCQTEPHSVSVAVIYNKAQALWEADSNCNGPFPIVFTSVEKTLNNHRAMKFRKAPKQCCEIESIFEDPNIRATFCESFHREKFCLYDTTFCCDDFSYCIYSSKKTIDLITNTVPQEERVLLMDATFSITPNRMFYQVLIIYVRYFEKVYPLAYILMTRKTQRAYEHALKFVDENVFPLTCATIITDYECAMRQAIRKVVPGVKLLGCWFHFAQAIRRKVASLPELFQLVRTQEKCKTIYYKMICLALLPYDKIEKAFSELALEGLKLTETFTPFVRYFQSQWLKRVGAKNFSVFLEETRTTCGAEGYNGKLGKTFQTHPNFFVFIESLQWEELAKSNSLEQHINGARQTQPKKEYRDRADLIRSESIKFTIPQKTNAQLFLNRVANVRNHLLPEKYEKFEDIIRYEDETEEMLDLINTKDANILIDSDKTTNSEQENIDIQTRKTTPPIEMTCSSDAKISINSKTVTNSENRNTDIQTRITTRSVQKRSKVQSKVQVDVSVGVKTRSQAKKLLNLL